MAFCLNDYYEKVPEVNRYDSGSSSKEEDSKGLLYKVYGYRVGKLYDKSEIEKNLIRKFCSHVDIRIYEIGDFVLFFKQKYNSCFELFFIREKRLSYRKHQNLKF
ncbi:MAG: hypothetical protein ACEPOW_02470 [Bacteroidales bacterium]